MNYSTIKKITFIVGLVFFFIVLLGYGDINGFHFDCSVLDLMSVELVPFSAISLIAAALVIYGMKAIDETTTSKRCKIGGALGAAVWLFLILSLFFSPTYFFKRYAGSYFVNWVFLCVSASSLIFFAIKYSKKD